MSSNRISHSRTKVTDTSSLDLTIAGQSISGVVLPAGVDHDSLINTHNLTTDIDHDATTNFVAAEHYDWTNETHNLITTGNVTTTNMTINGIMSFGAAPELTISGGVITVTASYHQVDTQSDAATDDLDTINGGVQGGIYIFRAANNARTVVFKNNTGNIRLAGTDFSLDHSWDTIMLIYDGVNWRELSRADNS